MRTKQQLFAHAVFGVDLSVQMLDDDDYHELLNTYFMVEAGFPIVVNGEVYTPTTTELAELFRDVLEKNCGNIPQGARLWFVDEKSRSADCRPGSLLLGFGLAQFPSVEIQPHPNWEWITWIESE